jgi:two-component system phosphate regulon sensor histidine kinase PhoR
MQRVCRWHALLTLAALLLWWLIVHRLIPDQSEATALRGSVLLAGALLVLAYAVIACGLWQPMARQLQQIRAAVRQYGQGRFDSRLNAVSRDEIGDLSRDLNWMAGQFAEHYAQEARRLREQEAVLSSLIEGVFAIDAHRCLISMNRAARQMLGLQPVDLAGRPFDTYVRNSKLQAFVDQALATPHETRTDIVLPGSPERHIEVRSSVLADEAGERIGALIVLNDLTQMRRLENMRRDFVANVSHELRTPITSIKGFLETLLDGAMHDPEESDRFLSIIARQADRLDAIIEDLLSLSRIEQEADRGEIDTKEERLLDIVLAAAQATQQRAESEEKRVEIDVPDSLTAPVNAALIEQAVLNLIDNAIKYSEAGGCITIRGYAEDDQVHLSVTDQGQGIEAVHLPRLFERFYRVDKSRSRKLGGTGLGLSIVKHIVQTHGGRVGVTSVVGQGSTFTISLPSQ